MKVFEGSTMSGIFDGTEEEIQAINDLVNKSCPNYDAQFSFSKIEEEAGWTLITAKNKESEFIIKYSSYFFDASVLIRFFSRIIDEKDDIALFLDNEGSWPILYISQINDKNVRFIFAHDYHIFMNDDIDEYKTSDYETECDVIVSKKELLENFYNMLYPFTINYNIEEAREGHYDDVFNIENGKKYLNEIKAYLGK